MAGLTAFSGFGGVAAGAQIALSTAVNLALKNSAKVRSAQAEVQKARAVLSQSKDAFVPAVSANGGVGKSTGAPLGPPVVFSISAQSLVFSFSQADYIRAARAGLQSAQMALESTQSETVEDVTSTYVALDNALERRKTAADALGYAQRLVSVADDRFQAGIDPHIELTKARHTEAQIRLQVLLIEDEVAEQAGHLAGLTGLSASGLTTERSSIPALELPAPASAAAVDDRAQQTGISAGFAAARAKAYTARGDRHFLLRPQVAFSANYSRISTAFTTYTQYYPYFGQPGNSFNSLNLGVEISVPILDLVRRAKAHESAADAIKALADAQAQQLLFADSREKLRRSTRELSVRRDLAGLDRDLAQDQLDAVLVRLRAAAGSTGGEQSTPKDEQNARLQERLRTLDMMSADLQLKQAEISLLRQQGSLSSWLSAVVPAALAAPSNASPNAHPPAPATIGTAPQGSSGSAGSVASPPTVGMPPATNPSSPVSTPAPATPVPSAPATPPVNTPSAPHP